MAPIVAPGIARFSVEGYYEANPVVNVLDINISDLAGGADREDACANVAGDLLNQWAEHVLPLLCDNYVCERVSWIDIDSLTGSTGERTSTDDNTWPQGGSSTAAALPGAVAARVNKNTIAVRGQRQGRMYICGIPEEATVANSPNTLTPEFIENLSDAMEEVRSGLEGDEIIAGGIGAYTSSPNVVHTVDNVYVGKSRITRMVVAPLLGTQVRRMRG